MSQRANKFDKETFPFSLHQLASALNGKVVGDQVRAPGPGHSSKDDSLSVRLDVSAPDRFVVHSFSGDDPIRCRDYVRERCGLEQFKPRVRAESGACDYFYQNERGENHIRISRRYRDGIKQFFQHHWENGVWVKGTKGIKRYPYRLPQLLSNKTDFIFFVEGEKDADRLASEGLLATTASDGASAKWKDDLTPYFAGRDVYILPDNDVPGWNHARKVASAIATVAASVKIVELPNLLDSEDVSDWLDKGGEISSLIELCDNASPWGANDNAANTESATSDEELKKPRGDNFSILDITEDAVAIRFAELCDDKLRYCHSNGAWFHWDGQVWRKNETQLAFHRARELARELSKFSGRKVKTSTQKASFASAVERFCRADPRFAVTIEFWDKDRFKLGTPGGTIDLKTGKLYSAQRSDAITKQVAVVPSNVANCPQWLKFLEDCTGGDQAFIRFLQQWCGYCLTGVTTEHALVFVHGGGGNGKSVFLNTVSGILNEYATTAAMDTFAASQYDKHPTDLAMLNGARMVSASETEEGRPWAESRIKQMTGGDPITARFMRQDFFSYLPQFKLTIIGNHTPVLKNVDAAAQRRFNIIPFTRKPSSPDRQLEEKLRQEWPAILRWMIDGCLDWQTSGLCRPESIVDATTEYFSEQDLFKQWIDDACQAEPDNRYIWDSSANLFQSWSQYSNNVGEKPGNAKQFASNLERRGFFKKRATGGARGFQGIRVNLKPQPKMSDA